MSEANAGQKLQYEAPRIEVLGSVHALTQFQNKTWGQTDGYYFQGEPITNAS
jgi:hypothetical protein